MLVLQDDLQPVVLVWVMGQNLVLLSNAGSWQKHTHANLNLFRRSAQLVCASTACPRLFVDVAAAQ
jgi:hypothetical protein